MPEHDEHGQQDPPATGDGDKGEQLGAAGLRALQAERKRADDLERQLKELRPLADRAREQDEASKTEVQRLTEQLEQARRDGSSATTERDRLRVAIAKGLTPTQAKRLVGTTEEELAADADELLADLGATAPEPPTTPPTKPREHMPRGGGDPTGEPTVDDVDKLGERMFRH